MFKILFDLIPVVCFSTVTILDTHSSSRSVFLGFCNSIASSSRMSCFQCQQSTSNPDHFRNGWRLRSGADARLCQRCFSAYEEGRFCETFHSKDDGWRKCESCDKLVHCGCIVSFKNHFLTDSGGIICMECTRLNFLLARNRCVSLECGIRAGESHQEPSGKSLVESQFRPQTDLEIQQVIGNSSAFAMGLATTLALLGVAASFAGQAYGQIGQGLPVAASILAVAMGLNLLEIIEVQLPSFFENFDPRAATANFPSKSGDRWQPTVDIHNWICCSSSSCSFLCWSFAVVLLSS